MLSSSLFPLFPVWRVLGEAAGRGLGPENPKSSLFCWQEVEFSGISHGVLAERAEGGAVVGLAQTPIPCKSWGRSPEGG